MKYLCLILYIFISISFGARPQVEEKILYYAYSSDTVGLSADRWMRRLEAELQQHGWRLQRSFVGEEPVALSVNVYMDDQMVIMEVQLMYSPLARLSPMLSDLDTQVIQLALRSTTNFRELVGFWLYAAEDCPSAKMYLDGRTITSLFYRGACALLAGDYSLALNDFQDILQLSHMEMTTVHVVPIAWAYFQLGERENAFELLDRLVFFEGSAKNISYRARLYALAFEYELALTDINRAIMLQPNDPLLYILRGDIRMLMYEWDRAMGDYNIAISLDPTCAQAYFARGVLFYTQANRIAALSDFERYLQLASPLAPHIALAQHYITNIQIELDLSPND